MGVHGLASFISENKDLSTCKYPLRNTHLVIDAFNLMSTLAQQSQNGKRADLFGGDMVSLGSTLDSFYDNLAACKIVPILVMDGAQTYEVSKSKVEVKLSRSLRRFDDVIKVSEHGFGHYVYPPLINMVFKSVAVNRGVKIYQSFFEADMEVARLARELKCPALSNDSDFYLIDLPEGVIPISDFEWHNLENMTRKQEMEDNWRRPRAKVEDNKPELFIPCKLYKRENFQNYLPNLDVDCLPLLAPLLGNDFVSTGTYSTICSKLPSKLPQEFPNPYMRKPLQSTSEQHEKIVNVLCFCCDKTLPQVINQLSSNLPKDERSEFKKAIKSSMDVYCPIEDTYVAELKKIYEDGFKRTYAKRFSESEVDAECDKAIRNLADWLLNCAEKSVMTHKVLELMNKNVIFNRPVLDDCSLKSSHHCRYRVYSVILRLMRPSTASKKPIEIYDRIGTTYEKTLLQQLHILDEFGRIGYLAYDVPRLPSDKRRDLVLATFHYNHDSFVKGLLECDSWFDPKHGDEFMTVSMILDYIDIENPDAKLWKQFRQATLLCMVYHLCVLRQDDNFSARLERENNLEFASGLKMSVLARSLAEVPFLGETRLFGNRTYNSRIIHQISQLHASIDTFNVLNSFLGDPLSRVRAEYWLNSCLIYNLTEALRKGVMKVPKMPDIIADGATYYSPKRMTSHETSQETGADPWPLTFFEIEPEITQD